MRLEDELRKTLRRHAEKAHPSPAAWDGITRRLEEGRLPEPPSPLRRIGVVTFALCLALVALLLVVRSFSGPPLRPGGLARHDLIAFEQMTEGGPGEQRFALRIAAIRPDGTGPRTIVGDDADYTAPAWSPDGRWLVADRLERGREGRESIVVMDVDGSNMHEILTRRLRTPVSVLQLAWSPDGSKIAFVRALYTGTTESDFRQDIFVMNADGSDLRQITRGFQVTSLAWSPDGTRIAFTKQFLLDKRHFGYDIHLVAPDGGDETRLTHDALSMDPAWSPDGGTIAFSRAQSHRAFQQRDLFAMNADGSAVRRLTDQPGVEEEPSWSPDGSSIAFAMYPPDRGCALAVVDRDGSNQRVIADRAALGGSCPSQPVWRPTLEEPRPDAQEESTPTSTPSATFDPTAYGSYRFRDVAVRPVAKEPRRDTVNVLYVSEWTGEQYPGVHKCRWAIFDADGDEIGSRTADFSAPLPVAPRVGYQVSVTNGAHAATASITCDPGRIDTPVAYGIANERVTGTFAWRDHVSGVEVAYDVSWPVQPPNYPSMNTCTVTVTRPTGEVVAKSLFVLSTGPGPLMQRVWRDEFSDRSAIAEAGVLVADVQCHPYTRPSDADS